MINMEIRSVGLTKGTKSIYRIILVVTLNFSLISVISQKRKVDDSSMYHVNKSIEIPLTLVSYGFNMGYGFSYLSDQKGLTEHQVLQLDRNDIWWFDRIATKQDVSFKDKAQNLSDIFLNASIIIPGVIGLDKKVREEWMDIMLMYLQVHAFSSSLYIGTAMSVNRTRPIAYNPNASIESRTEKGTRNSFFSGHVTTASCGSFFAAKVYSDLHPELGNKKYLLFGAASIPPAIVGYYRFKAMKHFPTDILMGFTVGAATGIIIPELHKLSKKETGLAFNPFVGQFTGLQVKYTFK